MPPALTETEIAQRLDENRNWTRETNAIRRTIECPSFILTIRLVDEVALVAEEVDHHPDIEIKWRSVTFTLSTHDAGGLTERDFDLARRIDSLIDGLWS